MSEVARKPRSDRLPDEVRIERRREASRRYRANHQERRKESTSKWRAANKDKIAEYQRVHLSRGLQRYHEAKNKPCADCGGTFHPAAMDFDHLPEFGRGIPRHVSMQRLAKDDPEKFAEEVAKCDVVCANCHRIRTWKRHHKLDERKA